MPCPYGLATALEECLSEVEYHDVPVAEQTPDRVREWILGFLDAYVGVAVS